jgi:3-phenylpropionate/cinnamic acid dioxygenase small subunit
VNEVAELLLTYARAIDSRAYEQLDAVFTPDATADYGALGGLKDGRAAIVEFLSSAGTRWDATQHFITNISAPGDGTARCYFLAYHLKGDAPPWLVGGEYHDRLVQTAEGWRIAHRTLVEKWRTVNG